MVRKICLGALFLFAVVGAGLTTANSPASMLSFAAFVADPTYHAAVVDPLFKGTLLESFETKLRNTQQKIKIPDAGISRAAYMNGFASLTDQQQAQVEAEYEPVKQALEDYEGDFDVVPDFFFQGTVAEDGFDAKLKILAAEPDHDLLRLYGPRNAEERKIVLKSMEDPDRTRLWALEGTRNYVRSLDIFSDYQLSREIRHRTKAKNALQQAKRRDQLDLIGKYLFVYPFYRDLINKAYLGWKLLDPAKQERLKLDYPMEHQE